METQEFHDFDAFANSVAGVDSRMLLRDAERRNWTIDRVELPGIQIQVGRLGSGNIACGQMHADTLMLYLPLTPGIEYRGNGETIERGSLFVLEPAAEFCITTQVSHDWCAVSIPIDPHQQNGVESRARSCRVARPSRVASRQFCDIVANVMKAAATSPEFETSRAAQLAASKLLGLVEPIASQRIKETQQTIGRPKVARDEIIDRSLAILEEDQGTYPNVDELASQSGVSERTLRTIFREYFGLGPSRFLQLRQLHEVRRALRSADPDHQTVSQILTEHGVWAFGRFAARYADLFGELPSVTLRG